MMPTFTYAPNVDGVEYTVVERGFEDRASAIAHGAAVLRTVVRSRPETAYVAVFCGHVDAGEPLGAWDWTVDGPVWAEES